MILNFIFSHLNAIVLGVWMLFLIIVAICYFQPSRSKINPDFILFKHLSKVGYKLSTVKSIRKSSILIGRLFAHTYKILHLNTFITKIGKLIKNISYLKLILIAIGLNIFYGLFVTWGQYYVWAHGSVVTKALLTFPLPAAVPFSKYLEWVRPLFSSRLGYFMFYAWGRIWLNIFVLFTFSGLMYLVFRIWKTYRGGFLEQGPELMLVLMLISGWMGVLVSLSMGFIFAILWLSFSYSKPSFKMAYTKVSKKLSKTVFKKLFPNITFIESEINKIVAVEPAFILATFFALIFTKIILGFF